MENENLIWSFIQNRITARSKSGCIFKKQEFKVGQQYVLLQWDSETEIFPSVVAVIRDDKDRNIVLKRTENEIFTPEGASSINE